MHEQSIKRRVAGQNGFTLIELMITLALFLIVAGFIFALFLATVRTATAQEAQIGMRDEARSATSRTMQLLRGARAQSMTGFDIAGTDVGIATAGNTAVQLTFQYPIDLDGDFTITSLNEYTGLMTLGLDLDDVNGDGRTTTQLIVLDDDGDILDVISSRVIAQNNNGDFSDAPLGGFTVQNVGGNQFTVSIVLQSPTAGENYPITVRESRTFELKNF